MKKITTKQAESLSADKLSAAKEQWYSALDSALAEMVACGRGRETRLDYGGKTDALSLRTECAWQQLAILNAEKTRRQTFHGILEPIPA